MGFLRSTGLLLSLHLAAALSAGAADWPQWRQNAGRTAETTLELGDPARWNILWQRELPSPEPAFQDIRLQFDAGYEPIVLGSRLVLGSNVDGSVAAYDTGTGEELWVFHSNGPVRFAPVGGNGRILFGSDDGWFYCLEASSGELVWKFQAVPSGRKLIGNRHLISVWPIRGGPVLHHDRVYFAAGVWPFEGVFVYCLDAKDGNVVWLNDSCGHIYDQQPHNTEALAGLAPQGYLLVDPEIDELVVPSSNAYPARFELSTGALREFHLPAPGRLPGGWFASTPSAREEQKLKRRGLLADSAVNAKRHEDRPRAEGKPDIQRAIHFADKSLTGALTLPCLPESEEVHTVIAGDDRLFVTTRGGNLYALAAESPAESHRSWELSRMPVSPGADANRVLEEAGDLRGHAVALGDWSPTMLAALLEHSKLTSLLLITDSEELLSEVRKILADHAQLRGRLRVREDNPLTCSLPPYFADLILVSDSLFPSDDPRERLFPSLRPYGGTLLLSQSNGLETLRREGSLEGSTNYTGDFAPSPDALVRAPLGVLWFDDRVGNFKRSPQPLFLDGTMITVDKDWLDASTRTGPVDYRLTDARFTDVYTGRELSPDEVPGLRQSFAAIDRETIQPSQYRPEDDKERPKPDQPIEATRVNPLTGEVEPRTFPRAYGCDKGIDYGDLYTMRSATAAFYDKTNESGTINLSGPRSGCTNSIIPANGLLNVPYFYEGCTCSYPLPTGLALYSVPESHEQWTAWGEMTPEQLAGKIEKIGINFGAPGDRVTRDGVLWIDHPPSGGPSPQVPVTVAPATASFSYRHAVFVGKGEAHPWVAGSGVSGLDTVVLPSLRSGTYRVVLTFCRNKEKEERSRFSISVNGKQLDDPVVLERPFESQARILDSVVVEDRITLELHSESGLTQISGIEAIRLGH